MTPYMIHYGKALQVQTQRKQVLKAAYDAHPERFVKGISSLPSLHTAVWINPPKDKKEDITELH